MGQQKKDPSDDWPTFFFFLKHQSRIKRKVLLRHGASIRRIGLKCLKKYVLTTCYTRLPVHRFAGCGICLFDVSCILGWDEVGWRSLEVEDMVEVRLAAE
jgi:hypothetical protein